MNNKKIIMTGLANNKTSLGEVFRRYIQCFRSFSNPDIFDLQAFVKNDEFKLDLFPQYNGPINHDVKYFHSTFNLYRNVKQNTKQIPRNFGVKKIGYFVWESSELHDKDVELLKDFDEIWTASNYCKDIFSQYMDSNLIKVVPHPIPVPPQLQTRYKKFTILIMGNISSSVDRKNIVGNLEVAKVIKQKYKDVDVILKTFTGSNNERTILKQIVGDSKIKVIDEYYSSEKVQQLIGKCHILLSLHRSEGFGLTLAEAMAVGTVPVATGYSGNIDFMKDNNSFSIDYKLIHVDIPYFKGQWAEPSKCDAIDKISFIYDNFDELHFMQKNCMDYINNNLIFEKITRKIYTCI